MFPTRFLAVFGLCSALSTPALASVAGGGLGLALGDFDARLGVQGNAYFDIPKVERLRIGGDVNYYLIDHATLITVAPTAHYRFVQAGVDVYGLAGLELAYAHASALGYGVSDTDVGLNVGAGLEAPLGVVTPFAEARLAIYNDPYVSIGGGIRASF